MQEAPLARKSGREADARLRLGRAFTAILSKLGFKERVVSSLYPISESFAGKSGDRLKLVDGDGEVLCVTEDAVTGLLNARESDLERLCAFTEIYRFKGQPRSEAQCAALITGFAGAESEAEMITSALSVLNGLGAEGFKIVLGHTAVLQGIAELYVSSHADAGTIRSLLSGEPATDAECALDKLLKETAAIKGGITALKEAAEKITNKTSLSGLAALFELSEVLASYGLEEMTGFDLSLIGRGYDNGAVFEIRDNAGHTLVRGGRHDFLRSDGVCRAVSFTMKPDELLEHYPLKEEGAATDAVIGVAEGIKALSAAYRLKSSLTGNNLTATVLYRTGREETLSYAKAFGIESAVYVDAEGGIAYE